MAYAAFDHPGAEDIAKNAGIGDTHGIYDGDIACRHGFNRRSCRDRRGP